jgi:putative hydrolase of the HAD superfamily
MASLRVIFDLDDTLYPERAFAISAFRDVALWAEAELGLVGLDAEMTTLLDDGHLGPLFTMALTQRGADPAHASGLIDVYRRHQPAKLDLYDDAAAVLATFAADGPIGLITDGTVSVQQAKVRALGLENRFNRIIYTHERGGRAFAKPHPAAFEDMGAAIGRDGDRFVYVGDNPAKDFAAPNRMGWTTVQIKRPQRIHARAAVIDGGQPHHIISTLAHLAEILGKP